MKVLVTGASGFVAQVLIDTLKKSNIAVVGTGRKLVASKADTFFTISDIAVPESAYDALSGCDVVIHLAARVHVMKEHSANPLDEFRKVNVEGTKCLAKSAARAGVKRFVYVSSIKVNGEQRPLPYTELDEPCPQDAYGVSKWEAEQALHKISAETGLEVVILRPPLVYGAGVKGNFATMIQMLLKGVPLPFASIKNLRSFVFVRNLVDSLILCATHPIAAGKTYLVSDGQDISTPDLLQKLSTALGHPVLLLPCSPVLISIAGRLLGKSNQVDRLLGSLQVDSSKIRRELGWQPLFSMDEGLKATASAYWNKS